MTWPVVFLGLYAATGILWAAKGRAWMALLGGVVIGMALSEVLLKSGAVAS